MKRPFVSIICSSYNHEAFLRQCIDGILQQKTEFCYELLIHDDASRDDSANIIREYAEKYPDLIKPTYQETNQYSREVNIWGDIQFPAAKGKYIALCEGDDYWKDPFKLQKQVKFLEENENYSACFTNADYLNMVDGSRTLFIKGIEEGIIPAETLILRGGAYYPTAGLVFRNNPKILEYFKRIRELYGDNLLIIVLAMLGPVHFINQSACVYRKWEGGIYSSTIDDAQKTIVRKKRTVLGLKKLLKYSDKHFHRYILTRVSYESLSVILSDGFFSNLRYLRELQLREHVRILTSYFKRMKDALFGRK